MIQTTTIETKSAQAEVEGYLVRRRDSSYPMGPINSYVQGLSCRSLRAADTPTPNTRRTVCRVSERFFEGSEQ